MPILDCKCSNCGFVFNELVKSTSGTDGVVCPHCGSGDLSRVYQGKCYGIKGGSGECTHHCATCYGCKE